MKPDLEQSILQALLICKGIHNSPHDTTVYLSGWLSSHYPKISTALEEITEQYYQDNPNAPK